MPATEAAKFVLIPEAWIAKWVMGCSGFAADFFSRSFHSAATASAKARVGHQTPPASDKGGTGPQTSNPSPDSATKIGALGLTELLHDATLHRILSTCSWIHCTQTTLNAFPPRASALFGLRKRAVAPPNRRPRIDRVSQFFLGRPVSFRPSEIILPRHWHHFHRTLKISKTPPCALATELPPGCGPLKVPVNPSAAHASARRMKFR